MNKMNLQSICATSITSITLSTKYHINNIKAQTLLQQKNIDHISYLSETISLSEGS